MVECLGWVDRIVLKAMRLRISISIEYRPIDWTATWPETATTYFVRISFYIHETGHVWTARVRRCWTS
jgi:hypothetical protein